jgi:hypothetical protein
MPRGVEARPDDAAEVASVFQLRDRFSRLDAAKLWPAPEAQLFDAQSMSEFAVSADGSRALVCSYTRAWVIDTRSMVASLSISLPSSPSVCALNADGSRAALVIEGSLYFWRLEEAATCLEDLGLVWSSRGLSRASILELSADARVAITSEYNQRATVRVYDTDALTMTHSFVTDSDECLILHPNGRHLICFGDDKVGRFYGRDGLYAQLKNCTGGAFSPDGMTLALNDYENLNELRVHRVVADGPALMLGPERRVAMRRSAKRWDCQARFSPNGRDLLISANNGGLIRVDIETQKSKPLAIDMKRKTAFLADNSFILSEDDAHSFGVHSTGLSLCEPDSGSVPAMLCASYGEGVRLVAVSYIGIYGCIEEDTGPVEEEARFPYERPSMMSSFLAKGVIPLDRDEQARLDEVQERQAVWQPHVAKMTADISLRQLIAVNRGLIELTPEIVERARAATSHPDTPRIGSHQVNLGALEDAASELRQMSLGARQEAFSKMVSRMRGGHSQRGLLAARTGLSLHEEEVNEIGLPASVDEPTPLPSMARATLSAATSGLVVAQNTEIETSDHAYAVMGSIFAGSILLASIGYYLMAS